ncbi:unnamed protein product [Calicophoron daubneyi]|uniref:Uncharacterized protein n=1 Tax=Calicophoron daubneyi TaxID=300641 RepID=A0AAV2TLG9_CALDB
MNQTNRIDETPSTPLNLIPAIDCTESPFDETNSSLSITSQEVTESTDVDLPAVSDLCNNNQEQYAEGSSAIKSGPVRQGDNAVWTEGLQWAPEDLMVIRSDVSTESAIGDYDGRIPIRQSYSLDRTRKYQNFVRNQVKLFEPRAQMVQTESFPLNSSMTEKSSLATSTNPCRSFSGSIQPSRAEGRVNERNSVCLRLGTKATLNDADRLSSRDRRLQEYMKKYFSHQLVDLYGKIVQHKKADHNFKVRDPDTPLEVGDGIRDPRRPELHRRASSVQSKRISAPVSEKSANSAQKWEDRAKLVTNNTNLRCGTKVCSTSGVPELSTSYSRRHSRFTIASSQNNRVSESKMQPMQTAEARRKKMKLSLDQTSYKSPRKEKGDICGSAKGDKCARSAASPTKCVRSKKSLSRIACSPLPLNPPDEFGMGENRTPSRCRSLVSSSVLPKRKRLRKFKSPWPKHAIEGFNTLACKLERINALNQQLVHIKKQLNSIQSYSRLARFYCLADSYLGFLCSQLAPHILNAVMAKKSSTRVNAKRNKNKKRFRRMNLLTLSPKGLKIIGLAEGHKRGSYIRRSLHQITDSVNSNLQTNSPAVQQSTRRRYPSLVMERATTHKKALLKLNKSCRMQMCCSNSACGKNADPGHFHPATSYGFPLIVGLPPWERKFLGISRGQIPPGYAVMAWKDNIVFTTAQSNWLRNMARRMVFGV